MFLDLKSDAGREIFRDLVRTADVVPAAAPVPTPSMFAPPAPPAE